VCLRAFVKLSVRCVCVAILCFVVVPKTSTQSRDLDLHRGIELYEQGKYPDAIKHLERAVESAPKSKSGYYYLAMVNDSICENSHGCERQFSESAMRSYLKILELDPSDKDATKNLAHLFHRLLRINESESYYRRALELDPNDPEALHNLAVICWERAYKLLMGERARLSVDRKKSLIGHQSCQGLRARALADVQNGLDLLTRASRIVHSGDVYAYLSLLYQLRSDLQCGDRTANKQDLGSARKFENVACIVRKARRKNRVWETDPRGWRWMPAPPPPYRRWGVCS
jgi:tetratricopeptide (TPR) repeat protein